MIVALKEYLSQAAYGKVFYELTTMSASDHAQYVGPYKLEKTLGKGQTGETDFLGNRLFLSLVILLVCFLTVSDDVIGFALAFTICLKMVSFVSIQYKFVFDHWWFISWFCYVVGKWVNSVFDQFAYSFYA